MFEISFAEIAVIAVVALVVLGPERLPVVARTVGGLIRRARASWTSLRSEIEREIDLKGASNSIASVMEPARSALSKFEGELRSTAESGASALAQEPLPAAAAPNDAAPNAVASIESAPNDAAAADLTPEELARSQDAVPVAPPKTPPSHD